MMNSLRSALSARRSAPAARSAAPSEDAQLAMALEASMQPQQLESMARSMAVDQVDDLMAEDDEDEVEAELAELMNYGAPVAAAAAPMGRIQMDAPMMSMAMAAPPVPLAPDGAAPPRARAKKKAKRKMRSAGAGSARRRREASNEEKSELDELAALMDDGPVGAAVTVKKWTANAGYVKAIKGAKSQADKIKAYLKEKKSYSNSPGFFFDVASVFLAEKETKPLGIRVLSNVLEMALEDAHLIRVVGYRLVEAEEWDLAVAVFQHVLRLRRDEPQSYRDLALSLATRSFETNKPQLNPNSWSDAVVATLDKLYPDLGQHCPRLIMEFSGVTLPDLQVAFDYLTKVVAGKWDKRFDEIELTALQELNQIKTEAETRKMWTMDTRALDLLDNGKKSQPKWMTFRNGANYVQTGKKNNVPREWLPPLANSRFISHMPCDLRISLAWDTDNTDIDLHVVEPSGNEVYYSNNWSKQGGFVSRDFTRGYGPEEYMVKSGDKGKYTIKAKYFSSNAQTLTGATTCTATVFTNWGRKSQERHTLTFRLEKSKDMVTIGSVELKK